MAPFAPCDSCGLAPFEKRGLPDVLLCWGIVPKGVLQLLLSLWGSFISVGLCLYFCKPFFR
ncbi:hypothetical protein NRI_0055 [Neorickettsia risticii str. Illinois]|uniref:Uncharacterized protein n=1 Tax=Neorickettsia risticii (strain Illinois) TaxID=434131 RepID=C6V3T7_NEORI|nr:hypothetical protein NRI_0055 [Neorickettsia risticii str. Illinois]